MTWREKGLVGAVVAFVAVNFLSALFITGFLENIIPGALAAWAVWALCLTKEKEELKKVFNPAPETWALTMPYAWGTVKDVLETSK